MPHLGGSSGEVNTLGSAVPTDTAGRSWHQYGVSEQALVPLKTKGHLSVAHVRDDWYPVSLSRDLKREPRPAMLFGVPLAIFRDTDGRPGAVLDRCPHRNVPLSNGRMNGDHLECFYHGWQFDRSGVCKRVPGLKGVQETKGRRVEAYAAREQDGFVWVYGMPDTEPEREPFRFGYAEKAGYTTVQQVVGATGTLHATAENALDVPHTAFLHGGLFRKDSAARNDIEVVVRRHHDRVEAQYIGEPRPKGLVGKLLAPSGGVVEHFDRFYLPSIVEVEYRLGERTHFISTAALTPVSDFETKLFATISFKLPLPHWLVSLILRPIAYRIFAQDSVALKAQTENIRRFGGEQYMSTDVDVLGRHILRLLRNAERGDRTPFDKPHEKRFSMLV